MGKRQDGRQGTGTRALRALAAAGVAHRVHPYEHDPAAPNYGEEAAARLGVPPERVFKTLVASAGDAGLVVAIVPVSTTVDLKSLAAAVGRKTAVMAEPADAERATGYVVGGISPLGQKRRLPVVADETVTGHPTVYVSAGRRGLQLELAPADLLRLTGARLAPIGRG